MVYDILVSQFKKQFYVISNDKYRHENSNRLLERYMGKHPLLTPEFIIVNDLPYGFKRLNRRLKSLEQFPVYCELEFIEEKEEDETLQIIESFDLFTEVSLPIHNRVTSLNEICALYEKSIIVERSKRIGISDQSSIIIYSKLGELIIEHFYEEEVEVGKTTETRLNSMVSQMFNRFAIFIKLFDEVIIKGTPLEKVDSSLIP